MTWLISIMILSVWANSVDPHQTAPSASSGRTALFKNNIVKILGHLQLFFWSPIIKDVIRYQKKKERSSWTLYPENHTNISRFFCT